MPISRKMSLALVKDVPNTALIYPEHNANPEKKVTWTPTKEFKEYTRREYKKLVRDSPDHSLVAGVMMVKNEHDNILFTLNSLLNYVDGLVVYDTGSTDDTKEIIQKFSEQHKLNLYFIEGEFVDFSTSRNVLLDYLDTLPFEFGLLLDSNDELTNGEAFRLFVDGEKRTKYTRYMVCQHWVNNNCSDTYFNVRLVRTRGFLRYCGRVHEYMKDFDKGDKADEYAFRCSSSWTLKQERNRDAAKSGPRYAKDKELLLLDHRDDPTEPRTVFYLAQTCSCLGQYDECVYYNLLRGEMKNGFWEERYHSYLRAGDILMMNKHYEKAVDCYLKAIEVSDPRPGDHKRGVVLDRAEPYYKLACYYNTRKSWGLAFMFAKTACECKFPDHCSLFIDRVVYDFHRWEMLSIVAFYAGQFSTGKIATLKALEIGARVVKHNLDYLRHNLKCYEDALLGIRQAEKQKDTQQSK